jgi:predicted ArsR family transcriptional regulator
VVGVLDRLGYAPVPDSKVDRVALTRCPLLQVASDVPEVVCNVHLGLVEELLTVSGADPTRASLTPFAAPGRCALRLLAPAAEVRRAAVPSR